MNIATKYSAMPILQLCRPGVITLEQTLGIITHNGGYHFCAAYLGVLYLLCSSFESWNTIMAIFNEIFRDKLASYSFPYGLH